MPPEAQTRPDDSAPEEWEVRVARDHCIGSGMCTLTAPGVFDQDAEEGVVRLLRSRLPRTGPDAEAALDAVGLCPAQAIGLR
ncbi:ferredoxin [Streptomyces sp. NBC_00237]|uniref:ferredoxin n=1 Tax=Streptomyces sp. NBC_00237 TaxID=2975687 RepID=UPI002259F0D6|nr:ferredoxin [Streptomyces sp. NBC_00237]MCX5206530.1 ferredoxin [Streptomyces sp. NBC_00237]